jgi:hypothetical protein
MTVLEETMFIRKANVLFALLALCLALPAAAAAQAGNPAVDAVKQILGKDAPRTLRITAAGSGYSGTGDARKQVRIEPFTQEVDLGLSKPDVVWSNPYGFAAAVTARPPAVADETLMGTPYHVVSVTTAAGQQVRGYVNAQNVLERTRGEITDSAGRTVQVETVFYDWVDFGGRRFPSIIIQKENGEVSRILVVSKVEPGSTS